MKKNNLFPEKKEQQMRQIIEESSDGIVVLSKDGIVTFSNPAAEKFFCKRREEFIGCPMGIPLADGETAEIDLIHKKDSIVLELRAVETSMDGERAYIVLIRDVTDRKEKEVLLRKYSCELEEIVEERTRELKEIRDKLVRKEKLALLGQMAGGVAHEMRNPLGNISNAIYFLNMVLSDKNEKVTEYLEIISSEVKRTDKIISDLMDFSRVKALEAEETELPLLITESLEKCPPGENIKVIIDIEENLPSVFVDKGKIMQVLINIERNAYQAMPDGGELIISIRVEMPYVHLSIADTGWGIPPENLEKIFDPLFTTRARGVGLGLAVCKSLIEANGGHITAESNEGKGTEFIITFPVEKSACQRR